MGTNTTPRPPPTTITGGGSVNSLSSFRARLPSFASLAHLHHHPSNHTTITRPVIQAPSSAPEYNWEASLEAPTKGSSGGSGLGWWAKRAQARERLRAMMDRSHHGSDVDASRHSVGSHHSGSGNGGAETVEEPSQAPSVPVAVGAAVEVVEAGGGPGASPDGARAGRNWSRLRAAVTMLSKARLEELVGEAAAASASSAIAAPPPVAPAPSATAVVPPVLAGAPLQGQRSVRWSQEEVDRQMLLQGQPGGEAGGGPPLTARSSMSRSYSIAVPPERLLMETGNLSSPDGEGEEGKGEKHGERWGSYGGWI